MKKKSIITLISLTLICMSFNLTLAQAISSDSLRINREGDISILIKTKSKSNLVFNRTIKWINSTYQNPEKVIVGQLQNESISVSGYKQDVFKNYGMPYHIHFTFKDSLVNYRFIVDEFKYESPSASPSANVPCSFFYKKDGSIKPTAISTLQKIEQEINLLYFSYIEQLNNNVLSSDEALAELKKAKDKLDLGIITQEEYDKLKVELMPFIK